MKQQPPSLSYREPPPPPSPLSPLDERMSTGTRGWSVRAGGRSLFLLAAFIGGLTGARKKEGERGKKKKERKRRKGKKAKLARKKSGATDFFSPALISRGMSKSRPSTRDGQHDFFSAFSSSLFFSSFSFRQSTCNQIRPLLSFFYLLLPNVNIRIYLFSSNASTKPPISLTYI